MMKNKVIAGLRLVYQVLRKRFALDRDTKGTTAFDPGGGRIAFVADVDGGHDIFTMRSDGREVYRLTQTRHLKVFPTWSPDGSKMAYLALGQLFVMHADGTNPHPINIGKAIAISPPAWSPDGKQIAYISVRSPNVESGLYIVDVATNSEHKLDTRTPINFAYDPPANTLPLTDAFAPSWSADGTSLLVFGGLGSNPKTILHVTLDGERVAPLLQDAKVSASLAVWSPDGSKILLQTSCAPELFVVSSVSTTALPTSGIPIWELHPLPILGQVDIPNFFSWSPDSTKLVFGGESRVDKKVHIYVINADGSELRQLTRDTRNKGSVWPTWGLMPAEQHGQGIGVASGAAAKSETVQRAMAAVTPSSGLDTSPRVPRIAFVAFQNNTAQIFTMDSQGHDIVPLANVPAAPIGPSGLPEDLMFPTLSPHGRMIAYLTDVKPGHAPALMVMDADGSNPRRINIGKAIAVSPPVWSPESKRLAYISVRSDASQSGLYIVDIATNTEYKVVTRKPIKFDFAYDPSVALPSLTDADWPAWSPNFSAFMVLGSLGTDEKTILQVTLDGTVTRMSTGNPHLILSSAAFSPDGLKVLHRAHTDAFQFWLIGDLVAQTTVELRLFSGQEVPFVAEFSYPSWSPDGKQIVFSALGLFDNEYGIYVINADGSELRRLTPRGFGHSIWPSWAMVPVELIKS